MGRYVIRRVLQMIPVIIGTTFIIFSMTFAAAGDPVQSLAGERPVTDAQRAALTERYNLDEPLVVQYALYMGNILRGDFGETLTGRQVSTIFAERWPVTLKLGLTAFFIEIILGLAAGLMSALKKGTFLDNLVLISTLAVISIPVFVLGRTLQYFVGVQWGILPVAGIQEGWPTSYIMPAFVLAALSLAFVSRLTRTSLVENLRADYVRTATAKGLSRRRVVGVHALRNSLIPVVTYLGLDLGALMGGAVVTEGVFNLPGIGQQLFQSVRLGEASVVTGLVTILVLIYLLATLVVDLLYAVLDPRIRYE